MSRPIWIAFVEVAWTSGVSETCVGVNMKLRDFWLTACFDWNQTETAWIIRTYRRRNTASTVEATPLSLSAGSGFVHARNDS